MIRLRKFSQKRLFRGAALVVLVFVTGLAMTRSVHAAGHIEIADVSAKAFAVVWLADQPVIDATVRVFTDSAELDEITSSLSIALASLEFPGALNRGIVKVEVSGLTPDTVVYVKAVTTVAGGTMIESPELEPVHTALPARRVDESGDPILNDVLYHDLLDPAGVTPDSGSLLLVKVPALSAYALSAFAGEGFEFPTAVVDLGNLVNHETGEIVQVDDGASIELTEYWGLHCPGGGKRTVLRMRRAPVVDEIPRVAEAWRPVTCRRDDTVCDGVVNVQDAQRVSNAIGEDRNTCGFNADLDVVADNVLDEKDVQHVLERLESVNP